jgi:hypothetical protein
MEDVQFSDEFCQFLKECIPAVDAAELLLVFQRRPDADFSMEEALARLGPGIRREDAERYMLAFAGLGMLQASDGRFRYLRDHERAGMVETLAQAYAQRPVTLVRVIYALRDSKIQTFAEAFKLRK